MSFAKYILLATCLFTKSSALRLLAWDTEGMGDWGIKEPSKVCGMAICSLHDKSAPVLYTEDGGFDGAGAKAKQVLNGLLQADQNSMNFGGTWMKNFRMMNGADYPKMFDGFFGTGSFKELYVKQPPTFDVTVKSEAELIKIRPSLASGSTVLLLGAERPKPADLNSNLLKALRAPLMDQKLQFARNRPTVAVHIRRGDVHDDHVTPDEYFFDLVETIRKHSPTADVHVWSSTLNGRERPDTAAVQKTWTSEDFEEYRRRGMTVHLDDEDLADIWVHFARADFLVLDGSTFSLVPALLNPNAVLAHWSTARRTDWPNWFDAKKLLNEDTKETTKFKTFADSSRLKLSRGVLEHP